MKKEELEKVKFTNEERKLREEHVILNKGFSILLNGVRGGFPELSKTISRLVNGLNSTIESYQQ